MVSVFGTKGVNRRARDILPTSRHRPGALHAAGWSRGASGLKKASHDGKSVLWVQPCGKFWIIERSIHLDAVYMQDEAGWFPHSVRGQFGRAHGKLRWSLRSIAIRCRGTRSRDIGPM